MSAMPLSKLDIDILVALALHGPDQATRWYAYDGPLPDPAVDPSALGAALWRLTGRDPGASRIPAGYVFERLPCPVTAIEGLKVLSTYEYRLEERGRLKGEVARFCQWLRAALIYYLPGFDEAPLSWSAADVDARADRVRAAAAAEVTTQPEPEVAAMLATLAAHGVPLAPFTGVDREPPELERHGYHDRPYRKTGHWASAPDHSGGPVHMRVYADRDAAHVAYVARRAVFEHQRGWGGGQKPGLRVARHGCAVIEYFGPTLDTIDLNSWYVAIYRAAVPALAALGEPDESWAYADVRSLAQDGEGTVLATAVALPLGYNTGITVVRDRRGLQQVVDLVTDPEAKQRILDTDLKKHTVLMMNGIANVDAVRVRLLSELITPDGRKPGYLLELTTDGLRYTPAVVVTVPKLPARPTEIDIYDSAIGPGKHQQTVFGAPSPWAAF